MTPAQRPDIKAHIQALADCVLGERADRHLLSYDDRQIAARLVTWLCCRQTVYATSTAKGCLVCR